MAINQQNIATRNAPVRNLEYLPTLIVDPVQILFKFSTFQYKFTAIFGSAALMVDHLMDTDHIHQLVQCKQ